MEIWKDVVGYEGMYQVSSYGRVRSLNRIDGAGHKLIGSIMKLAVTRGGYLSVTLSKDVAQRMYRVNRLVAVAFIENPSGLPHAAHNDDNRQNNRAENLYWSSVRDNLMHNDRHIIVGKKIGKHIKGINKENVLYFDSSLAAARDGFNASAIRNCLTGRAATHKGFEWQYV